MMSPHWTMTRADESNLPEWASAPVRRCEIYLEQVDGALRVTEQGVQASDDIAGEVAGAYLSFRIREDLRESRRAGPSTETEPQRDQKFHERMRLLAQELAAGLPVLWELASVGIWGALEACMEDLAVAWLLNHRATLAHPDLAKLKLRIPLTEFELLDAEGRMRLLLRIIKTEFSISDDVDGYERIFGLFAMGSAIRGDLRRTLIELCEVRNVLLHRAGYVDERLLRECPWLGLSTGHRILIRRADYERYRKAVGDYLDVAIGRLLNRVLEW